MVRHKPMVFLTGNDPRMVWLPSYSKTNGDIPLEDLAQLRRQGSESYHYLRFHLDAKVPGNAILQFNDPEELHVFVGGEEVEQVGKDTRINLKPGINKVTVAVHASKRKEKTLRIEVLDAPSNSAQVQVIYGK